jgi:hypothetical protein
MNDSSQAVKSLLVQLCGRMLKVGTVLWEVRLPVLPLALFSVPLGYDVNMATERQASAY